MKTTAGRLALGENKFADLAPQPDGSLTASFTAERDGFYHVELVAPERRARDRVAAVHDRRARGSARRRCRSSGPGRDTTASAIEEVFVEAKAEDDFGVRDLELVYSVNGGAEKVVKLFGGQHAAARGVGRPHVLPRRAGRAGGRLGVLLRARDGQRRRRRRQAAPRATCTSCASGRSRRTSGRRSRRAAAAVAVAVAAAQVEALSEQQRQIISATFNVQRDRKNVHAGQAAARARPSWRCRSRACASRSKGC